MTKRWLTAGIAGALLSGISYTIYRRYEHDIKKAYARIQSGSHLFLSDYGPMEYAIRGNGLPILVIHGIGGGYDHGLLIGNLLEDQYKTISPSRFGYLRSMLPANPSPENQAHIYSLLLDELDIQATPIAGISAGGISSLEFALNYPERCSALLMISSVSHEIDIGDSFINRLIDRAYRNDFLSWFLIGGVRPTLKNLMSKKQPDAQYIRPSEKAWADNFFAAALPTPRRYGGSRLDQHQLAGFRNFPLHKVSVPTLIIHAADDRTVSVDHAYHAAESIPDSQLLILPNGGHMLLGHHKTVRTKILDFLSNLDMA